MIKENEVYKIGKIGKPHGVKGEVTLRFSDAVSYTHLTLPTIA